VKSQSRLDPTAEEWRPFPDIDGIEVSSAGRVRVRVSPNGAVLLRTRTGSSGYTAVTVNGTSVYVHTLVALAFLGPRPADHVVVHRDDDITNNHAANLAYATRGEAQKRAYARGTRQPTYGQGKSCRSVGLTEEKVRMIRDNPEVRPSRFAREFGVTCNCICAVRSGKSWRHVV
jgi:hypothetical protein